MTLSLQFPYTATTLLATLLLATISLAIGAVGMKRANGKWVSGEDFWNREVELELFSELLDEEAHILLIAQRRIGKTSFMREIGRRISERYICLQVDLERSNDSSDAIAELGVATRDVESLWGRTKGIFTNIIGTLAQQIDSFQVSEIRVNLRGGMNEANWREKGNHLISILASADRPVVIFFDELPILVNRMLKGSDFQITPEKREQTDQFMSWLRANSIEHQGKVRFVVAGSIGLEPVLQEAGLSATINNFTPFDLPAWTHESAKDCVLELAKSYDLNVPPEIAESMVNRLGLCIPHYVQMYFDRIRRRCMYQHVSDVTEEMAKDVYENDMLGASGHVELSHFEERLKLVLGPNLTSFAIHLLTEASVTGSISGDAAIAISERYNIDDDGEVIEIPIGRILNILEHDGYLVQSESTYRFASKLLEDWWKARFAFTYQPNE